MNTGVRRDRPKHCVVAPVRQFDQRTDARLEAYIGDLVTSLRARQHEVVMFTSRAWETRSDVELLLVPELDVSERARCDLAAPSRIFMQEHHAYLSLMLTLQERCDIDIVHDHSQHHLPIAMASSIQTQVATTLHTSPTPWLAAAVTHAAATSTFLAIDDNIRQQWKHLIPSITNSVETVEVQSSRRNKHPASLSRSILDGDPPHVRDELAQSAAALSLSSTHQPPGQRPGRLVARRSGAVSRAL